MAAPIPADEEQRLSELRAYGILDTLPEQAYDDITYLAAEICGSPIALISLVDEDRQWFKSAVGLEATETPRDVAFCAYAAFDPTQLLIVPDATADPRFSKNPLVTSDPRIRFYAGAPLVTSTGRSLGALCVIDREPRELSPRQARALHALARQVMAQLELRRTVADLERSIEDSRGYEDRLEKYQRSLEASFAAVTAESVTDSLTRLKNRRAFEVALESEHGRCERYGTELAVAMLDIDNFKSFNDTFGHPAGDGVLRTVARLLEEEARTTDFVARVGGEEFAVLFPNTSVDAAHVIAERFRKALSAYAWEHRDVTVSIGVAEWSPDIAEPEVLISLADKALYRAKQEGRNMVVAVHPVHEDRASRRSKITLLPATDRAEAIPGDATVRTDEPGEPAIDFVIDDTAARRRLTEREAPKDQAQV